VSLCRFPCQIFTDFLKNRTRKTSLIPLIQSKKSFAKNIALPYSEMVEIAELSFSNLLEMGILRGKVRYGSLNFSLRSVKREIDGAKDRFVVVQ